MDAIWLWAIAIVLFGILEAITAQLVSIWFLLGAIGALVTALCHGAFWLQIVVFFVVSIITLLVSKPLVKKVVSPKTEKTNADRCIGETGIVIEEINNVTSTGQVKINGNVWTARSTKGDVISKDALVIVDKIDGVKLMVTKE